MGHWESYRNKPSEEYSLQFLWVLQAGMGFTRWALRFHKSKIRSASSMILQVLTSQQFLATPELASQALNRFSSSGLDLEERMLLDWAR